MADITKEEGVIANLPTAVLSPWSSASTHFSARWDVGARANVRIDTVFSVSHEAFITDLCRHLSSKNVRIDIVFSVSHDAFITDLCRHLLSKYVRIDTVFSVSHDAFIS